MALPYRIVYCASTMSLFASLVACSAPSSLVGGIDSLKSSNGEGQSPKPLIHQIASDTGTMHPVKTTIAAAVVCGSLGTIHYFQQRAWWLGPRSPFWFKADLSYALNMDKWGHVYASYVLSKAFAYTLTWCGLGQTKSTIYGAGIAAGYQLVLEAEDGFRAQYGFDPVDAFADIAGAVYPALQQSIPFLQNFSLKYSYLKSADWDETYGNRIFLDDYNGMTLWLGVDPHFLMGPGLAKAVPRWLGVAVGYAVRDIDYWGKGRRIYYFALDYNLSKIETSDFLHALFTAVDFIHLPAPGIRLDEGKVSFGIFFR